MKTNRAFTLLGVLLLVTCAGGAAWLDHSWFMGWRGNRAGGFSPLKVAIGDGQKIFAGHFYRKADVYYHSGMYPSIFDNNESFKTPHIGEDAGAADSKNTGDEEDFLGQERDIIDRFSRNFFPSRHTHLDDGGAGGHVHSHGADGHSHGAHGHSHGGAEHDQDESGEVREMLPWLKLAQELDPEDPLTYTVTAYWLRQRMGKVREAELFLREGLKHLPGHPGILFELGRIFSEDHKETDRARNLWQRAAAEWQKQEGPKPEPDLFIFAQIHAHLAQLEEAAGNIPVAISHWEQLLKISPEARARSVEARIAELRVALNRPAPPK